MGKQVAEFYQKAATKDLENRHNDSTKLIAELKRLGRETEIEAELRKRTFMKVDKNLAYVEVHLFEDYLHDMTITQHYASLNRKAIVKDNVKQMKFKVEYSFMDEIIANIGDTVEIVKIIKPVYTFKAAE